jgi:hypothetical protein
MAKATVLAFCAVRASTGKIRYTAGFLAHLVFSKCADAIALGRKNFRFVGNENVGDNPATLYSLVATCEARDVNPFQVLRDVRKDDCDDGPAKAEERWRGA